MCVSDVRYTLPVVQIPSDLTQWHDSFNPTVRHVIFSLQGPVSPLSASECDLSLQDSEKSRPAPQSPQATGRTSRDASPTRYRPRTPMTPVFFEAPRSGQEDTCPTVREISLSHDEGFVHEKHPGLKYPNLGRRLDFGCGQSAQRPSFWSRPILRTVLCVMLVGSFMISSRLMPRAPTLAMRKTIWLAQESGPVTISDPTPSPPAPGPWSAAPPMTKGEELAALTSFITGTVSNSLPDIDGSVPIPPEILLPFDYAASNGREELENLVQGHWERYPVLIIGRLRDPKMHKLRETLTRSYTIKPRPLFVEYDQRIDNDVVETALERLLGEQDEPWVLIKGESMSADKVAKLESGDGVVEIMKGAGMRAAKRVKKNKHAKEEERTERERILGPGMILDV